MLKVYILISFLIILSGCTKNPDASLNIAQVQNSLAISGDGNFGSVTYGDIKYKTFVIQNLSSDTIAVSPVLRNGNNYSVGLTLGCQAVLPGKGV